MALDYVKRDVTRYLLGRRFERLGAPGEAHVIFPYPGLQPLPFPQEDPSSEDLPFTYPDEKRWWIWPLKYADEIPLSERVMSVVRNNVFAINSLSGGRGNTLPHLVPLSVMPKLGYPMSSIEDAAELEFISLRAKLVSIVIGYKTTHSDLFGETFTASSDDPEEAKPPGRFFRGVRRISPTLARKLSSRNLRP